MTSEKRINVINNDRRVVPCPFDGKEHEQSFDGGMSGDSAGSDFSADRRNFFRH